MKPAFYKTFFVLSVFAIVIYSCNNNSNTVVKAPTFDTSRLWFGSSKYNIPEHDSMARYGYQLISNTSYFLGPNGTVAHLTNGMNCQNCHLDGGTKPWGNNYGAVASLYPQFRARSGGIETIVKRISDCMERSLNGTAVDSTSKEMKAIIAYMNWLGKDVPKKIKPKGSGIMDLPYLDRAADPKTGSMVYTSKCQRCHGANGQGQKSADTAGVYTYPPLWGEHSYNTAAGLYRLSRFAGYVKNNMPFGEVSYHSPLLTNEEAWDVAAFVNSQSRPSKTFKEDWPDISKKPVDHPFGPYADGFSEEQHKFGPFKPIVDARKKQTK